MTCRELTGDASRRGTSAPDTLIRQLVGGLRAVLATWEASLGLDQITADDEPKISGPRWLEYGRFEDDGELRAGELRLELSVGKAHRELRETFHPVMAEVADRP